MRILKKMDPIYFAIIGFLLIGTPKTDGGQIISSDKRMYDRLLTPDQGCGYSKVQNTRIVGGAPAKNGAWPWMALLFYVYGVTFTKPEYKCGGSLITSRHVLTAAHCIRENLYFVRLGEYDTSTTDDGEHQDIKISKVQPHEDFEPELFLNDIAILNLEREVVFNDRIRPICLPLSKELINRRFVGYTPFLAGWGTMREGSHMSSKLQQVQVPVNANNRCKQRYLNDGEKEFEFDDRVVCAGFKKGNKDSCQGDSGGPLMLPIAGNNGTFPFYQIGIISWANGCAKANLPGVNTNVQYFADWILRRI